MYVCVENNIEKKYCLAFALIRVARLYIFYFSEDKKLNYSKAPLNAGYVPISSRFHLQSLF